MAAAAAEGVLCKAFVLKCNCGRSQEAGVKGSLGESEKHGDVPPCKKQSEPFLTEESVVVGEWCLMR